MNDFDFFSSLTEDFKDLKFNSKQIEQKNFLKLKF